MSTAEYAIVLPSFHSIGRSEGQKTRFNALDTAIVQRAVADLREHPRTREFSTACHFFFKEPCAEDIFDALTFESLCQRNGIHSEIAAKAIWDGLPNEIQLRIKHYLTQCQNIQTIALVTNPPIVSAIACPA